MQNYSDIAVVPEATFSDIKTPDLSIQLALFRKANQKLSALSDEELCEKLNFTKNGIPTLSGYLLFNDYPQQRYINSCIKACVVLAKTIEETLDKPTRFLDSRRFEGNLFDIYKSAETYIFQNFVCVDNSASDHLSTVVREALINAIVHRDYNSGGATMLYIYPDRMELINPCGDIGDIKIAEDIDYCALEFNDKNPHIIRAFENRGLLKIRHTGVPIILNAMKNAGFDRDIFSVEKGCFKVTLYKDSI